MYFPYSFNDGIDDKYRHAREMIDKLKHHIEQICYNDNGMVLQTEAMKKKKLNELHSLNDYASFVIRRKLHGHLGKIYSLCWSYGDCTDIVSASQDGTLLIWNTQNGMKKFGIKSKSPWIMTCQYSQNNKLISIGRLDKKCSIYNISNIKEGDIYCDKANIELIQHKDYVSCSKFINNEELITSSGDGTCCLWDICKAIPIQIFDEHKGNIDCIDMNKDNSLFVSVSYDAFAKVWDHRDGYNHQSVATFKGHETDINCVKWFGDGNAFVSGSDDATLRLFDLKAYRQMNIYGKNDIYSCVTAVDFSSSGYYIFSGYDEDPFGLVWNTMTAEIEDNLSHNMRVSCLQTSYNGYGLATGCCDKIIRIWA